MFDHLLESSHRDDSNKWQNTGFSEVITQVVSIEVIFKHLNLSSGGVSTRMCVLEGGLGVLPPRIIFNEMI